MWHILPAARQQVSSSPVNICLPGVPDAVPARCCISAPAIRAHSADAVPVNATGARHTTLPGTIIPAIQGTLAGCVPDAVGAGGQLLALAVGATGAGPAVPRRDAALTYAAGSTAAAATATRHSSSWQDGRACRRACQ
jgi:hypothetical protein